MARSVKRVLKNQGVFQIFSAMLLVIGVMVVSMYSIYRLSISSIYDKVTQNNSLAVQTLIQSFDNNFRSINNIIHSIHAMPYPVDGGDVPDMSNVFLLQDNIASLISSVDFIKEAVVFYNDLDIAITSEGTSSLELLFNQQYKHERYNLAYWRNYMKARNSFKIFPVETYRVMTTTSGLRQTTKKLMVVAGGNKVRLSSKNIILFINEEEFMKQANQSLIIPGSSLIVLDQDQQVIFSSDAQMNMSNVLEEVYLNSNREASLTKGDYEYHFYKSDLNEYTYIERVPFQFSNIDSVGKANRIIMFMAVLGAVLLSILLSIYLNKPVKRIMNQLGGRHGGNDFQKILSGVIHLQAENENYLKQLVHAEAEERRGVLLQAIDDYASSAVKELQRHGADFFIQKLFVMVVIQLKPADSERDHSAEALAEALQGDLRSRNYTAQVFYEKDLQFIALVGMRGVQERDGLLHSLGLLLGGLKEGEFAGYEFRAGVSKVYSSELANCRYAYRNAVKALHYRHVHEEAMVLDASKTEYDWHMYYPYERIEKLSNAIVNGKQKESKDIIGDTIGEAMERNVHYHQLSHVAKSMYYAMVRHAGPTANQNDELYGLERKFVAAIERMCDERELQQLLLEVAKHVANHVSSAHKQVSKLNPVFISQYIELNYMRNLYLDHIAEVTETSPKYFSSYFKKTFGVNYVEYLNKVRLSHAREMLKHSTYTVAEIGEKTGYLNASTFTTTFKKYYGISPSEYRKQHMG